MGSLKEPGGVHLRQCLWSMVTFICGHVSRSMVDFIFGHVTWSMVLKNLQPDGLVMDDDRKRVLCDRLCLGLVCRGRYGLGGVFLLFILGSNLGGGGPVRGLRWGGRRGGVRSGPGAVRTILLFHTISVRPFNESLWLAFVREFVVGIKGSIPELRWALHLSMMAIPTAVQKQVLV
jgi:hypothetical protein